MYAFSCLLANVESYRSASNYMQRSGSAVDVVFIVGVLLGIAALAAGLHFWDKHRKKLRGSGGTSGSLLTELAEAHGLSRSERTMLTQGATAHHLDEPALLFVDPSILQSLSNPGRAHAKAYASLMRKIFGQRENS